MIGEESETQDNEPLVPDLYSFDRVRPILASDGLEEIRCKPRSSRCRPFSFRGCSSGIMPLSGLAGVMGSGDSTLSISMADMVMLVVAVVLAGDKSRATGSATVSSGRVSSAQLIYWSPPQAGLLPAYDVGVEANARR